MSPDQSLPTQTAAPERGAFMLKMMPVLAFAAWAGAVASVTIFQLNKWDQPAFYGTTVPLWVPIALLAASFAAGVAAVWRKELPYAYLCVALLAPWGTGDRLTIQRDITGGDLLGAVVFGLCAFLAVEYLTALRRFDLVLRATRSLDRSESRPVNRFLFRYMVGAVILAGFYAAFLWALVLHVVPTVAGKISSRMRDGLELETAWGIALFALFFLSLPVLVRVIVDGVLEIRRRPRETAEAAPAPTPAPATPTTATPPGGAA